MVGESIDQVVKHWDYLIIGASWAISSLLLIKKGKKIAEEGVIQAEAKTISEQHIDNKMEICALQLERKLIEKQDIKYNKQMGKMKEEILEHIELMIKAIKP